MIYDCFIASYELDALEVRFREYEDIPDLVHIALEATTDFMGRPRELTFPNPRFDRWHERISSHALEVPNSEFASPWGAEHWLRNVLLSRADEIGCRRRDLVMVSDGDEIPTKDQVRMAASDLIEIRALGVTLPVDYRELKADWRAPDYCQPPNQPYMAYRDNVSSAQLRREPMRFKRTVPGKGWHLSSMGGPENVRLKLSTFSHAEEIPPRYLSVEWLADCAARGRDLLDRFDLEPVAREPGLVPDCVLELPHFSHLLRNLTDPSK